MVIVPNREEMGINKWLALPNITGGLDISDATAKTTTRTKAIMLLAKNISRTTSGEKKDVIRKSYPGDKRYRPFPETHKGHRYLNTSTRRRASCRGKLGNN